MILLFIISGAIFLMSTNDLVSIFLSIELQSYGLYLLSAIYRNSELSTTGGLIYFLLGGFSSCFILLGLSLLYANSGTTNMDGLYIIASLSDINSLYKPYYINFSLLIFCIGFLFKVSAAPFHFWSPDRGPGKSSLFGSKLPNSGNTLELLVPSRNWKIVGGWINHSCKVTSQKASEKNVGNRGSKSVILKNIAVKEQRVYGSWYGDGKTSLGRSILNSLFLNYWIRILTGANRVINKFHNSRLYTSIAIQHNLIINPWFVTGFSDAEACFTLSVIKSKERKVGWHVYLSFQITLHTKDKALLEQIQSYFGGAGSITRHRSESIHYSIQSVENLIVILNHFDKYPLITQKWADYQLFQQALMLIQNKERLTIEGLSKIVAIKASMNTGLSDELKAAFPDITPVQRPNVLNCRIKDPNWCRWICYRRRVFLHKNL